MYSKIKHKKRGTEYAILGVAVLDAGNAREAEDYDTLTLTVGAGSNRLMLTNRKSETTTNTVTVQGKLRHGRAIAVYVGPAGDLWARDMDELMDGRFEHMNDLSTDFLSNSDVRNFLSHGLARTGANSSRIRVMAQMIVRLAEEVLSLRNKVKP